MKISGVILCKNEEAFISNAIDNIYSHVDELIIVDDKSEDGTVTKIHQHSKFSEGKIRVYKAGFLSDLDFSIGDKKNFACSLVKHPWTLLLDADEVIENKFYEDLRKLIEQPHDAYALPRINLIDKKKTNVYPDYQYRLFRSFCRQIYGVHHELIGFQSVILLERKGYHIIHDKNSYKQEQQNALYDRLNEEKHHMNRWDNENYAKE